MQRAERLLAERENLIAREVEFLRSGGFRLVVSDIAAIPVEAAKRAGLSAMAVGNFSWDWIYSAFTADEARWEPVVEAFADGYAQADLLLRLPFAGEMRAFSRIEDVPLLASPGRSRRAEIAALTGSPPDATWILLSFTTLEWGEEALDCVERMSDCRFFTVLPLCWKRRNIHSIDRECIPFPDIVASVDAVVSKPGYGIVSECVVNRKPLIYADRSDFLEYSPLVSGIRKYLKQVHIPAQRLYAGDLRAAVDSLKGAPDPTATLNAGGAPIAARRILDFLQ